LVVGQDGHELARTLLGLTPALHVISGCSAPGGDENGCEGSRQHGCCGGSPCFKAPYHWFTYCSPQRLGCQSLKISGQSSARCIRAAKWRWRANQLSAPPVQILAPCLGATQA